MTDSDGKAFAAQDPRKFSAEVLKHLNPAFPEAEILLLTAAFQTDVFQNPDMHLYFQSQLRKAIDAAMLQDPLFGFRYRQLARVVTDASDLYQGTRAVYNMVLSFQEYATAQQAALDMECSSTVEHLRAVTLSPVFMME